MQKKKEVVILMVEDDMVDRRAMKRVFKKLKIINPLVFAKDGLEGLKILRQNKMPGVVEKPFLIILDLNMPRMNGHEFLKEIRKDPHLQDSIVFVLTTSKAEQDKVAAYNYNIAGYIVKQDLSNSFMKAVNLLKSYWCLVDLPE